MPDFQFEEDKQITSQTTYAVSQPQNKLISLLIKYGLAKSEKQALYILFALAIIMFVASLIIFKFIFSGSVAPLGPVESLPPETTQIEETL